MNSKFDPSKHPRLKSGPGAGKFTRHEREPAGQVVNVGVVDGDMLLDELGNALSTINARDIRTDDHGAYFTSDVEELGNTISCRTEVLFDGKGRVTIKQPGVIASEVAIEHLRTAMLQMHGYEEKLRVNTISHWINDYDHPGTTIQREINASVAVALDARDYANVDLERNGGIEPGLAFVASIKGFDESGVRDKYFSEMQVIVSYLGDDGGIETYDVLVMNGERTHVSVEQIPRWKLNDALTALQYEGPTPIAVEDMAFLVK